jgi:hypothetical protein
MNTKMSVFLDAVPCSNVEIDRQYRDAYCIHYHGDTPRFNNTLWVTCVNRTSFMEANDKTARGGADVSRFVVPSHDMCYFCFSRIRIRLEVPGTHPRCIRPK